MFKKLCTILISAVIFLSCNNNKNDTALLFREITADKSGITFNNEIIENDRMNIINYEYLYNGGGVGIGDFNNDSLPDIYFTGSVSPNKLYINKGGMRFEDVTAKAGVSVNNRWSNGVSIVDINNDGLLDIYVSCATLMPASFRKNLLYINQGADKATGIPAFKEMAEAYGLADSSSTQMAAFFDYDKDGDLDVYLLVNEYRKDANQIKPIKNEMGAANNDRLLQNNWDAKLGHPVYTDVSRQAGIVQDGFGLGVNIVDINADGWKDIYVSNDFVSNNHLYINNKNGTFTEKSRNYFKHTSRNAMGNEAADINNDGLVDIMEVDMSPQDNYRIKKMYNPNTYQVVKKMDELGYMRQDIHNCLQLNQGPRVLGNDSIGEPVFSDVAYYSGIAQTDWSWAPLAIDADNDGFRDIMISNGLPKDLTDLDFMAYREASQAATPVAQVLNKVPSLKLSNFIYHNNGDVTFTDKTMEWGWGTPTFSAGMAYADFDRDGDVDVVVNNTNMMATLLENTLNENKNDSSNYVRIQLQGDSLNRNGIGAVIHLYYDGKQQLYECSPYRGYLSTVENIAHFGLGAAAKIDSLIVEWPNNKRQLLQNVSVNKLLTININDAQKTAGKNLPTTATQNWFTDITALTQIQYADAAKEAEFIDFNIQRLIPHKLSQYGPSLAVADLNGDGLDDMVVGGSTPNNLVLFMQQAAGTFNRKQFLPQVKTRISDDMGICLFDADSDGDLDMYVASGSNENLPNSKDYGDKFYLNDGKANFTEDSTAFPINYTSKSCVKACDYDNDGDLDLFVGGRVMPGVYPKQVSSMILRNETANGKILFLNVTEEVAAALLNIGLVCDAVWSDADGDGDQDLLVVGEWMPPTILKNTNGIFLQEQTALTANTGWYNSIAAADIGNDGDMDYVLGNFGKNAFYKTTSQMPVQAYSGDFDNNGSYDVVLSNGLPSSPHGPLAEYPVAGRDEIIREMSYLKGKFPDYDLYAKAPMSLLFTKDELQNTLHLTATDFSSVWIENKGNLKFEIHALPAAAQFSNISGIVVNDMDGDGNVDIVLSGNDYGMAAMLGRNDAFNGLVLKGDGQGNFQVLSLLQSGVYIPGNAKALACLVINGKPAIAATQNAGPIKVFQNKNPAGKVVLVNNNETYAMLTLKNGNKRKEEFQYGSSFLSQSARYLVLNNSIKSIEIFNSKKQSRIVTN